MKYISVVHPRMDDDEIGQLIAKGVAGALFSISHHSYPMALKLIQQVKDLSRKYKRPVSIIQDVSQMQDPMDLEMGVKSGVDWVMSDKEEHMKMARGLNKLIGLISKGRNLPKSVKVDSVMSDIFADPDAEILGSDSGQIRHLTTQHRKQHLLDSIAHFADNCGSAAVVVNDLDLAKALSWRRVRNKIVYAPEDHNLAAQASLFKGVHPVYFSHDLGATLKDIGLVKKGDRIMDATEPKHVAIHLVH